MMINMNLFEFIILFLLFFFLGMALHWLDTALSGYCFAFRVSQLFGRKIFLCFHLFIYYRSFFVFFLILLGWLYEIPPFELGIFCCCYILATMFLPINKIASYIDHLLINKKYTSKTQISAASLLPPCTNNSHDSIDLQLYQILDKLLVTQQNKVVKPIVTLNTFICPICHTSTILSSTNLLRAFCDSCGVLLTTG